MIWESTAKILFLCTIGMTSVISVYSNAVDIEAVSMATEKVMSGH